MRTVEMQKEVEIVNLTNILNESANKYYNGEVPTLSDVEYDALLNKLESLENEVGMQLGNSPTKRVGYAVLSSIPKKVLPRKMLSLDKIKNDVESVIKWTKGRRFVMSLKMDGLSCMLEYVDGVLVGCYTRGNGIEGSDVTEMVKSLPSVPNRLKNGKSVLVIGEVIIRKSSFERINSERAKNGEDEFANPRNLASGTLLSLDTALGRKRGLEFIAFDVYGDMSGDIITTCKCQQDKLFNLETSGFNVVPYIVEDDKTNIEGNISSLETIAYNNGYPIDGIVFAYDSEEVRANCKPTDKFPTHSIAYKFKDEYEETILRDIEWSMSRNGTLTPVAIFDAVELDGTEVSRANVHNISIMRALELGIGDVVRVVKANQIIPQIIENSTKSNNYELPTKCPYCGGELAIEGDNSLELICGNENCTEQQLLKINHFLSKEALNTKGVSEKILKKLMSFGEISNLYDVLALPQKREHLIKKNYPTLGRKTINNICDAIESTSTTTLDRFLIGLGIDGVGKKVAKDIVKKYPTVYDLHTSLSITGLKSIEGIDSTAESIYRGFKENFEHINKILTYITIEEVSQETAGSSLDGKVFVFTGKTSEFKNRKEVEEFIVANGGKMSGSVSSKTSFLICNAVETSSKYKKAQELGIEIITDTQLKEMVRG